MQKLFLSAILVASLLFSLSCLESSELFLGMLFAVFFTAVVLKISLVEKS
jgi:hypothetical protein